MIHTRTVVPLPGSCVDRRLERMNTKTKILLTSQAQKSIDLKSNTLILSRYAIVLVSHLLTIFSTRSVYLLTLTVQFCRESGVYLAKIFSVTSLFIFYFGSCSALFLAACFFFLLLLFLAQVYIIKNPADEANRSEGKSERTAKKCMSLKVFLCVQQKT